MGLLPLRAQGWEGNEGALGGKREKWDRKNGGLEDKELNLRDPVGDYFIHYTIR